MLRKILLTLGLLLLIASVIVGIQIWHENAVLERLVSDGFITYKMPPLDASDLSASDRQFGVYLQEGDFHFEKKNYTKAITSYRLVQQESSANSSIRQTSEWHESLALYHLNGHRNPSFLQLLSKIEDQPNHIYQDKAKMMHRQLDNFFVRLSKG